MSSGTVEMASARFFTSSDPEGTPPLVWTRDSKGFNNIVVMSNQQIAVSTLPKSQLPAARELLEQGAPVEDVLGPHGTRIRFQAVQAVTACLHSTQIEVLFDKGGRRLTTCSFPTANQEQQVEILAEARQRMQGQTEVVEKTGSRLWHAIKPFNLLVLFAMLSIGAQNYFTTDLFDGRANRERLEKWGRNVDADDVHWERAKQRAFVKTVAYNPALQKVLVFGIIVLGVVGAVLNTLGYGVTMTVLLGGTGLALVWTLLRVANPPRTMSLVSCGVRRCGRRVSDVPPFARAAGTTGN